MDCCCCLVAKSCLTVTFVIPWTEACQAPLPMGVPRQENWSGLTFLFPGNLSDPRIKFTSPGWQPNSLPLSHLGKCRRVQSLWKANWTQSHSMTQFHSYINTTLFLKTIFFFVLVINKWSCNHIQSIYNISSAHLFTKGHISVCWLNASGQVYPPAQSGTRSW